MNESSGAGAAVVALRGVVDVLLSADLLAFPGAEMGELLGGLEVERNRLDAVDARVIAEAAHQGLVGECAAGSMTDLLVLRLRVAPGQAKARVARGQDLGPRRSLTGKSLPPILPAAAVAWRRWRCRGLDLGRACRGDLSLS